LKNSISCNSIIRTSEKCLSCDLGDGTAILNPKTGSTQTLNSMGSRIWDLLKKPIKVENLVEILVNEYEVSRKVCEQDTLTIVSELYRSGILEVTTGDIDEKSFVL